MDFVSALASKAFQQFSLNSESSCERFRTDRKITSGIMNFLQFDRICLFVRLLAHFLQLPLVAVAVPTGCPHFFQPQIPAPSEGSPDVPKPTLRCIIFWLFPNSPPRSVLRSCVCTQRLPHCLEEPIFYLLYFQSYSFSCFPQLVTTAEDSSVYRSVNRELHPQPKVLRPVTLIPVTLRPVTMLPDLHSF